jgi:hypothetical protein
MKTPVLMAAALWLGACSDAAAWGCDGHRAVVYIAERLVPPATLARARAVLTASPAEPALRRFCDAVPDDPLVDDAAWADDYRAVDPGTAGWHFINLPRQARLSASNEQAFCPAGKCVVEAIVAQYRLLTTSLDPQARANALRFVVHLVGDIHQPLHATTNGDRGGNCVPVTYYDRAPQESPTIANDFSPNLHGVWDASTIRTLMTQKGLADPRALAGYVVSRKALPVSISAQVPTMTEATRWAQASHGVGGNVVYNTLSVQLSLEPATALTLSSCTDNHDIVHRMLSKRIVIDATYERSSVPAILDQLWFAGVRLAATLRAAFG